MHLKLSVVSLSICSLLTRLLPTHYCMYLPSLLYVHYPGDNIHTACAIAEQCGILTPGGVALEGPVFRNMTPKELDEVTWHAFLSPPLYP